MSEQGARVQLQDLLEIIEIICSNIGYSRFIEPDMLVDYRTYFDICYLIFQELGIKIIKIQENRKLPPGQKLQLLIDLLSQELQIDDFEISGEEIVDSNPDHIHRLLEILYEYSKIYMNSKRPENVVKSAPEKNKPSKEKQTQAVYRCSAREPRRAGVYQEDAEEKNQSQPQDSKQNDRKEQYLIQEKAKKRRAHYSAGAKRARSQQQIKKNLHLQAVQKIIGQKTNMLRAASRDNRKSRLQSTKQAKNSYKIFLKRYTKENIAANRKKAAMKAKAAAKPVSQQLPLKDFELISNFFQSFSCKFRDQKSVYLRRIQRLIRQQELDRFCYQNKLDRQLKSYMNQRLESQLNSRIHQHRVRSEVLRENSEALDKKRATVRKDMKERDNQLKRELKANKINQLKKIESAIREHNEKVLMDLEEGGRLEQTIMQMYKRF